MCCCVCVCVCVCVWTCYCMLAVFIVSASYIAGQYWLYVFDVLCCCCCCCCEFVVVFMICVLSLCSLLHNYSTVMQNLPRCLVWTVMVNPNTIVISNSIGLYSSTASLLRVCAQVLMHSSVCVCVCVRVRVCAVQCVCTELVMIVDGNFWPLTRRTCTHSGIGNGRRWSFMLTFDPQFLTHVYTVPAQYRSDQKWPVRVR